MNSRISDAMLARTRASTNARARAPVGATGRSRGGDGGGDGGGVVKHTGEHILFGETEFFAT